MPRPLDINGYNETFRAFTNFAQARVDAGQTKAVARDIGDPDDFAGRTITAATTDKAYAFKRSRADKEANDAVRTLFKNAIIEMFGGEAKIPASVKRAMLLGDYGKGKPLTARRIMAVKAAIDRDGTAKARAADAALDLCATNADQGKAALVFGSLRMTASIEMISRTANLYAKATGNPLMFKTAVKRLKAFNGKTFAPGMLTAVVNAAKRVDIGKLKKLSSASTPEKFHAAFLQYHKGMTTVLNQTRFLASFDDVGADEAEGAKMLAGGLIAAHFRRRQGTRDGLPRHHGRKQATRTRSHPSGTDGASGGAEQPRVTDRFLVHGSVGFDIISPNGY